MTGSTEDLQSSPICSLNVGKARKKNGYYTCPVSCKRDKKPFYVHCKGATLMGVKEIGNTLMIRCKNILPYIDELTSSLLQVVELNHTEWFNSSIDETFLEEYFTTPIHYDNKHGIILRMKIKNIEEIESVYLQTKVDITFVFKNITFLRQKFYPVFEVFNMVPAVVSEFEIKDDIEQDVNDEEEEDVVPAFDEVLSIKQEKMEQLSKISEKTQESIDILSMKLEILKKHILNLENSNSAHTILKCCEEIDEEC
jgi:hypothetical protein